MNWFQVIALVVVAGLLVLSVAALARGRAGRKETVGWCAVWLLAGAAILDPQLTTQVARALGIQRGADLLLYTAVVVMLIGFLMIYLRMRRLRRDLTLVVRHLAIRDAESGES
ncbi:MAG: DUF2304 family protein [Phycisphaerae bacterium]